MRCSLEYNLNDDNTTHALLLARVVRTVRRNSRREIQHRIGMSNATSVNRRDTDTEVVGPFPFHDLPRS